MVDIGINLREPSSSGTRIEAWCVRICRQHHVRCCFAQHQERDTCRDKVGERRVVLSYTYMFVAHNFRSISFSPNSCISYMSYVTGGRNKNIANVLVYIPPRDYSKFSSAASRYETVFKLSKDVSTHLHIVPSLQQRQSSRKNVGSGPKAGIPLYAARPWMPRCCPAAASHPT